MPAVKFQIVSDEMSTQALHRFVWRAVRNECKRNAIVTEPSPQNAQPNMVEDDWTPKEAQD